MEEEILIDGMTQKEFGRSAYKNSDGMNYDNTPILAIDEEGIPKEKIDIEALDKSIRAFWISHEKELWAVVILCGFYFIAVLI